MQFTGLGGITRPDGLDLARAGVNTEALLVAEPSGNREPRTFVFTAGRPSALIASLATIEKLSRRAVVRVLGAICPAPAAAHHSKSERADDGEDFPEIAAKPRPRRVRYSGITRIVAVPGIGPGIGEGDGAAP